MNDGVTLTKVNSSATLEALNTIMPDYTVRLKGGIRGVIEFLEHMVNEVILTDKTETIEFVLLLKPEKLKQLPEIKFSAEGLSAIEILWIACNRTSLEYEIKGNKVYIDKKS